MFENNVETIAMRFHNVRKPIIFKQVITWDCGCLIGVLPCLDTSL
jgi:hypothetical protein